jgi:hypothetical protein
MGYYAQQETDNLFKEALEKAVKELGVRSVFNDLLKVLDSEQIKELTAYIINGK